MIGQSISTRLAIEVRDSTYVTIGCKDCFYEYFIFGKKKRKKVMNQTPVFRLS